MVNIGSARNIYNNKLHENGYHMLVFCLWLLVNDIGGASQILHASFSGFMPLEAIFGYTLLPSSSTSRSDTKFTGLPIPSLVSPDFLSARRVCRLLCVYLLQGTVAVGWSRLRFYLLPFSLHILGACTLLLGFRYWLWDKVSLPESHMAYNDTNLPRALISNVLG